MKDLKRVHADISFVPPLYSVSLSACEICIEIEIKTCLYEYTRKTLHLNWNTITRYMYVLHCSILAKDPVCRLLRSTSVTCVYYPNANVCYYGDSKNKKDLERVMALKLVFTPVYFFKSWNANIWHVSAFLQIFILAAKLNLCSTLAEELHKFINNNRCFN